MARSAGDSIGDLGETEITRMLSYHSNQNADHTVIRLRPTTCVHNHPITNHLSLTAEKRVIVMCNLVLYSTSEAEVGKIRNLRDVGSGINTIMGYDLMVPGVLFRSGALDEVVDQSELPDVKTILSLRRTQDPDFGEIVRLQAAPRKPMNNYVISADVFREWIQRLFGMVSDATIWPALLHCTAGKDRTGVGVGLILKNLGIPDSVIVEEYSLSEGKTYPESLEWLLGEMASVEHLRMRESQLLEIKRVLLQGS